MHFLNLPQQCLVALVAVGAAAKSALKGPATFGEHVDDVQSPQLLRAPDDLRLLSDDAFSVLSHVAFPRHSVRIKKSDFCDGTVASYTGYIDIEARHMFFYFFESRNNPDEDDVIFWTNGGPGVNSTSTEYNPYGWNDKANIFFVEQPVGVGFSYAEYGELVSTTEEAAVDIAAFVAIFFEHFKKFTGKPFHMAGESYGGRYVPHFAATVLDQNAKLIELGLPPVNLASVMLGNGLTNWLDMIPTYYDMKCTGVSLPPVETISACARMKQAVPRCVKMMKEACFDQFDFMGCEAADLFCQTELAVVPADLNPYDLSRKCEGELRDTLCYPITQDIGEYLNRPETRALLGADPTPQNWSAVDQQLNARFNQRLDIMFPTQIYLEGLLERGVRVLVYVGVYDLLCNWIGNERMTLDIQWSGQSEYAAQPLREWIVDGTTAGLTRGDGPLTFATIFGAGHMVPHDKPKEALELVNRWMAQGPI